VKLQQNRNRGIILHLHIYFTPADLLAARNERQEAIYIVIDVIRATTTMSVLFEQGASRILAAENVAQAREAAQKIPGRFLCGERNVKPLPGFDYGNSPVQFSHLDLQQREMILTTTNGTRAFHACPENAVRLGGCFYNAQAVATYALHAAFAQQQDISIVCSGELGNFALDDATCAGYLARQIQQLYSYYERELNSAQNNDAKSQPLLIHESVEAAITLYDAYKPPVIIDHCDSARSVIEAGLADDVYFCMQMSQSSSIPKVVGREEETGLLILEQASRK
jgi:2-phosphosulfolactate phosphatase